MDHLLSNIFLYHSNLCVMEGKAKPTEAKEAKLVDLWICLYHSEKGRNKAERREDYRT